MLLIVRHGRTVANAEGLLQGRVDNPLDAEGLRQAKQIRIALGPIDVVVSSPLQRALQTAKPLGLPCRVDERWIELDYGHGTRSQSVKLPRKNGSDGEVTRPSPRREESP